MTDSDNTTTLSLVTRRRAIVGTAIAAARPSLSAFACRDLGASQSADPGVVAWCKWRRAHEETEWLCHQQQRLEQKLIETIGYRSATTLSAGETMTMGSAAALSGGPIGAAVSATAEADLAAHQAGWARADREIGYSATLRAEREAANRAANLLMKVLETSAASCAGVAAKPDAVRREGQSSKDDPEFPWPQIRSALVDVFWIGVLNRAKPGILKRSGLTASNRNHTAKVTFKHEDLRAVHLHPFGQRTRIRHLLVSEPPQWPAKC